MLNWFVDEEAVERVTRGGDLIEEYEVECRPERIPQKCLDENICIGQMRKYFSSDAWSLVEDTIDTLQNSDSWPDLHCLSDRSTLL